MLKTVAKMMQFDILDSRPPGEKKINSVTEENK